MNKAIILLISAVLIFSFFIIPSYALSKNQYLSDGIEQYKQENYEEAVKALTKAREKDPESTNVAFFLGLACKQIMDYPNAARNFRDAVTMVPRIKDALIELIASLHILGELDEAREWIRVAEKENIYPAKTAFLKGMVLQKAGLNMEAINSFENAKAMDQTLAQSAEFNIALCYIKAKKLKIAKKRFDAVVLRDPQSDLAGYARQYQDIVEKKIDIERPLHLTLGIFGRYDDNVVSKPYESVAATGITNEESSSLLTNARIDFMPLLEGPWLFNAQYFFSGNYHKHHSTTHDLISNGVSIAPGYNFGRFAVNLLYTYNHSLKRGTSYKQYLDYMSSGPMFRMFLDKKNILELFVGYSFKEYNEKNFIPDEDRDSEGLSGSINWIWLFKKGAFFNLKFGIIDDNSNGRNWENTGQKISVNTSFPLIDKLNLQLSGEVFYQHYNHPHTFFLKDRRDDTYQCTAGLTWELFSHARLIAQYSKTRAFSNIEIYDYDRNSYTAGIEYRF